MTVIGPERAEPAVAEREFPEAIVMLAGDPTETVSAFEHWVRVPSDDLT